jgi:putative phosphoesterase
MLTLGVIADTHIPDRTRHLNPKIIPLFREAGVQAILHAGDVSVRRILEELRQVAPVYAVRGNRDWVALRDLPMSLQITFRGVKIGLVHGHGSWREYLIERVYYILNGYRLERFTPRLLDAFPEAQVIVFGHTHHPVNLWQDGKLLFNPGSPHFPADIDITPSIGFLHIHTGGDVEGEIYNLL